MKRTIDEIYNIIVEKRKNAIYDRTKQIREENLDKFVRLNGEIEAYTDVLCLIESSQILKEDNEK